MDDNGTSSYFCRRRHAKNIKTHEGRFRFVLGQDIFMDRVSSLCTRALVRHLEYYRMGKKAWIDWAMDFWKPLLTYTLTISLLSNGWIVFVFLEVEHASLILDKI